MNVASGQYLQLSPVGPARPNQVFCFNHQNKIIVKSPFPVLINFVRGTLHLRLLQRCVVRLYVTHNLVCVTFTATQHRTTCEHRMSGNKTSKRKVFCGNLQLEHILFYFHNLFSATFWVRKEIKFGYSCSLPNLALVIQIIFILALG